MSRTASPHAHASANADVDALTESVATAAVSDCDCEQSAANDSASGPWSRSAATRPHRKQQTSDDDKRSNQRGSS